MDLKIDETEIGLEVVSTDLRTTVGPPLMRDLTQGLRFALNAKLYRWDEQLCGYLLGYSSVYVKNSRPMVDDSLYTSILVKGKFLTFKPVVGMRLEGQVIAVEQTTLTVNIFNTYQATLKKGKRQVAVGERVKFKLKNVSRGNGLPLILSGTLTKPKIPTLDVEKPVQKQSPGDELPVEKKKKKKAKDLQAANHPTQPFEGTSTDGVMSGQVIIIESEAENGIVDEVAKKKKKKKRNETELSSAVVASVHEECQERPSAKKQRLATDAAQKDDSRKQDIELHPPPDKAEGEKKKRKRDKKENGPAKKKQQLEAYDTQEGNPHTDQGFGLKNAATVDPDPPSVLQSEWKNTKAEEMTSERKASKKQEKRKKWMAKKKEWESQRRRDRLEKRIKEQSKKQTPPKKTTSVSIKQQQHSNKEKNKKQKKQTKKGNGTGIKNKKQQLKEEERVTGRKNKYKKGNSRSVSSGGTDGNRPDSPRTSVASDGGKSSVYSADKSGGGDPRTTSYGAGVASKSERPPVNSAEEPRGSGSGVVLVRSSLLSAYPGDQNWKLPSSVHCDGRPKRSFLWSSNEYSPAGRGKIQGGPADVDTRYRMETIGWQCVHNGSWNGNRGQIQNSALYYHGASSEGPYRDFAEDLSGGSQRGADSCSYSNTALAGGNSVGDLMRGSDQNEGKITAVCSKSGGLINIKKDGHRECPSRDQSGGLSSGPNDGLRGDQSGVVRDGQSVGGSHGQCGRFHNSQNRKCDKDMRGSGSGDHSGVATCPRGDLSHLQDGGAVGTFKDELTSAVQAHSEERKKSAPKLQPWLRLPEGFHREVSSSSTAKRLRYTYRHKDGLMCTSLKDAWEYYESHSKSQGGLTSASAKPTAPPDASVKVGEDRAVALPCVVAPAVASAPCVAAVRPVAVGPTAPTVYPKEEPLAAQVPPSSGAATAATAAAAPMASTVAAPAAKASAVTVPDIATRSPTTTAESIVSGGKKSKNAERHKEESRTAITQAAETSDPGIKKTERCVYSYKMDNNRNERAEESDWRTTHRLKAAPSGRRSRRSQSRSHSPRQRYRQRGSPQRRGSRPQRREGSLLRRGGSPRRRRGGTQRRGDSAPSNWRYGGEHQQQPSLGKEEMPGDFNYQAPGTSHGVERPSATATTFLRVRPIRELQDYSKSGVERSGNIYTPY